MKNIRNKKILLKGIISNPLHTNLCRSLHAALNMKYTLGKNKTNHIKFWIKLWIMQWKHIKFTVTPLQFCGFDTGCSVPFSVRCHMSSGSINDFRWTTHTHTRTRTHVHFGQTEFPATVPCRLWLTPKSLTHDVSISVNAARIIGWTVWSACTQVPAKIRAVKWNLFHPFKCNRSQ